MERLEGSGEAIETPIGFTPTPEALDLSGLEVSDQDIEDALKVDPAEWAEELTGIDEWFAEFGESLPETIRGEAEQLRQRIKAG